MTLSAVSGFSRQEHWSFLLQCMKVKSESEVAQSYPTLSDRKRELPEAPGVTEGKAETT